MGRNRIRPSVPLLATLSLLLALWTTLTPPAPAQTPPAEGTAIPASAAPMTPEERGEVIARLDPRYKEWLQSVLGLITVPELDYFLRLREDYRRDAFQEAFWEPRDPEPRTPENELRERWDTYRRRAGGLPYDDPRFLLFLFNGPPGGWNLPDGRPVTRCYSRSRELEIWFYGRSERVDRQFPVIFLRRSGETPYEAYRLGESLRAQPRTGSLPTADVSQLCADEVLRYTLGEMQLVGDYDGLLDKVLSPPLPSPEWLATFSASDTDLPAGAETFEVRPRIDFPARKQSRTAVRVLLGVPREEAPGQRFDGELFHHFRLVGEVIRDGRLFESFRYRFEGPTPEEAEILPLGFTAYLRPGTVELRVLLEDVYSGRYAQLVRWVEVPSPEGLPSVPEPELLVEEATGPALRLVEPPGDVLSGLVRFRAYAEGELDRVTFYLDGQRVLSKRSPPYSVELDLGAAPVPHTVRVVGERGGREVTTDQIWINQGAQRFRVRLVEPRAGGIYPGSVATRVEVETPGGAAPERVELYLGDELAATLEEPPYAEVLELPGTGEPVVVRAVARLADGSWAEEAVVINGSPFTEEVEVRLVELPVLVTGRDGRPITGLDQEAFRVFDGGVPRPIERFLPPAETPVRAALLVDRSSSMAPHLGEVTAAALEFATAALATATEGATAGDAENRVAVFSFAERLAVDADFTPQSATVDRALAGLQAVGRTALYDALVRSFQTLGELGGAPALVLFTDGRDEASRLGFEETLTAARRAGTVLYAIGLEASFPDKATRRELERLATETGGRALFLESLAQLPESYATLLEELQSRYLLTYQPPEVGEEAGYREIRVEVEAEGAEVRTREGWLP